MEVDDAIERIGGFGPAQRKIVYLINLAHFLTAFHALCYTFIAEDPGWHCVETKSKDLPQNVCAMVELGTCTPVYSLDFTSIVSEWNLICSKSNLPKLSQSAYFLGLLLGAWMWGRLTDMIGRRKVFFISCFALSSSGLGYGLAVNFYFFVAMRFLNALFGSGFLLSSFVLSVEIVGRENRNFAGLLGSALFGIGYAVVALMAYFIRSWRNLVFIYSGIGFFGLFLWNIIPESPRWLVVQGRMAEARSVLASLAQGNGAALPSGELKKPDAVEGTGGVVSLLSGPVIRKRTLILFGTWFANCIVYYTLAMRTEDLGSNKYIRFALSGIIEIPAIIVSYKLLNRVGRRWTHGSFLLSAGSACLLWGVVCWTGHLSVGPPLALFGKFAVAASFCVIYLYTAELFPTQVRNLGVGVASVGARLGGILAPIVLMTDSVDHSVPMLVNGGLAFLMGLLSLRLPETLNEPLPDTLQDLEAAGRLPPLQNSCH